MVKKWEKEIWIKETQKEREIKDALISTRRKKDKMYSDIPALCDILKNVSEKNCQCLKKKLL